MCRLLDPLGPKVVWRNILLSRKRKKTFIAKLVWIAFFVIRWNDLFKKNIYNNNNNNKTRETDN